MRRHGFTRRQLFSAAAAAGAAGLAGGVLFRSFFESGGSAMETGEQNKRTLREFVRVVWEGRDVAALPAFWTADCVNHAGPAGGTVGLDALRAYHEGFVTGFLPAFTDAKIEFLQQVAEGDRVVSQMTFRAAHTGPLFGKPPTGKVVTLASIRIDRFEGGKIAEHWSVADMAGFTQQLG